MSQSALIPVGVNYSGGTSSEWMVEAINRGVIKRPALCAVFFSDTKEEHGWTYDAINEVEARCRAAELRFIRCALGPKMGDVIVDWAARRVQRMDNPPLFIDKGDGVRGQLNQRCSQRFKSEVIRRAQWRWLKTMGMPRRIVSWIGFAADETKRATKAVARKGPKWVTLDFPAVRLGVTREQQRADLIKWTGRAPKFSMCVCCPWKTPARWRETTGDDLARAIQIDEAVRNLDESGLTDGPAYLSSRLIPVADLARTQHPVTEEEPTCDAGACFL